MAPGHRTEQVREMAQRLERDLSAIRRALRKPLEAEIARGELTVPQTAVMQVVVKQPGISLKDLSEQVSLAHSTVSGIADRLEKKGLIERRQDTRDGRFRGIYPAVQVIAFVRDTLPNLASEPLLRALVRASDEEQATIQNALHRLRELLEQE